MIELEQLQQLIAFSEYGTISSAADAMHLSQPALTRSLQRLEAELGVSLFDRKRNRVVLNGIGELAVTRARGVLDSVSEMGEELRIYETRLSTLTIGSCGPAPMWDLAAELGERFPEKTIATELGETDALIEGLERGRYRLILTELPVERPEILCRKYNEERLCVALPPEHPLSGRASIRLAELGEESVLSTRTSASGSAWWIKTQGCTTWCRATAPPLPSLCGPPVSPAFPPISRCFASGTR